MQPKQQNTEQFDRTIARFEELLIELQMIFLEIFSNYARKERDS